MRNFDLVLTKYAAPLTEQDFKNFYSSPAGSVPGMKFSPLPDGTTSFDVSGGIKDISPKPAAPAAAAPAPFKIETPQSLNAAKPVSSSPIPVTGQPAVPTTTGGFDVQAPNPATATPPTQAPPPPAAGGPVPSTASPAPANQPPVTLGPAAGPFATQQQNTADRAVVNPITQQPLAQPAPAQPQNQGTTAPEQKPVPEGGVNNFNIDEAAIAKNIQDPNLTPEQRTEVATNVATQLRQGDPALYQGMQDFQAGKNTPNAQRYEAMRQQQINAMISAAAQADPEKAATPQGFAEIAGGVYNQFRSMHPGMQALVGLGLPIGLIGIFSSLFGEGGIGAGILGALGLGAAGLGAASGGLFGENAQNAVNQTAGNLMGQLPQGARQGLYDTASFFGAAPGRQDLSKLTSQTPIKDIINGGGEGLPDAAAVEKQLAELPQQKAQLEQLLAMDRDTALQWLPSVDPNNVKTPEDAERVLENAQTMLNQLNDPNSELNQHIQKGRDYTNPSESSWFSPAGWAGWWQGNGKDKNAAAIEKWAFNAMDAKELHDLEKEKAKGAPRRIDDARRVNELRMRHQANKPSCGDQTPKMKRTVVVMCMKSARCWAGYEPVPGKAPYSEDSCRPKSRPTKKKKKEKAEAK